MITDMTALSPKPDLSRNQILSALPETERRNLLPHLQVVSHGASDVLYRPGDPVRYVHFPLDGVVSLLTSMEDGKSVGVTLIGSEGLLEIGTVLGSQTVISHLAVVQVPGSSARIKAQVLQERFQRGGAFQDALLRYASYLLAQISQTAACNRVHLLEQRLARWLLMVHNRVKQDEFPITHEFFSQMLGTPRSEVTLAAGMLRKSPLHLLWPRQDDNSRPSRFRINCLRVLSHCLRAVSSNSRAVFFISA